MISIILIGLASLTELWSGDERHRHGGSGIDTPPVGLSLQGDWRESPMIQEVVALKKMAYTRTNSSGSQSNGNCSSNSSFPVAVLVVD